MPTKSLDNLKWSLDYSFILLSIETDGLSLIRNYVFPYFERKTCPGNVFTFLNLMINMLNMIWRERKIQGTVSNRYMAPAGICCWFGLRITMGIIIFFELVLLYIYYCGVEFSECRRLHTVLLREEDFRNSQDSSLHNWEISRILIIYSTAVEKSLKFLNIYSTSPR